MFGVFVAALVEIRLHVREQGIDAGNILIGQFAENLQERDWLMPSFCPTRHNRNA
jgi:hypothetical protein